MMHDVLNKKRYAAMNIDADNRSAICAEDLDNGSVFQLKEYEAHEDMLWKAEKPAGATDLGIWMASGPEIVITELPDGTQLKGVDKNIRDFTNVKETPFDAFKPEVGDVLEIAFGNPETATAMNTNTHLVVQNDWKLKPAMSAGEGFAMKKIAKGKLHIGDNGSFVKKAVPTYKFVVLAN